MSLIVKKVEMGGGRGFWSSQWMNCWGWHAEELGEGRETSDKLSDPAEPT